MAYLGTLGHFYWQIEASLHYPSALSGMHAAKLVELWMGATVHYRISVSTFCKAPGSLNRATPFQAVGIRPRSRFSIE